MLSFFFFFFFSPFLSKVFSLLTTYYYIHRYLFNPFVVITCVSMSTILLNNFFIVLCVYFALKGESIQTFFFCVGVICLCSYCKLKRKCDSLSMESCCCQLFDYLSRCADFTSLVVAKKGMTIIPVIINRFFPESVESACTFLLFFGGTDVSLLCHVWFLGFYLGLLWLYFPRIRFNSKCWFILVLLHRDIRPLSQFLSFCLSISFVCLHSSSFHSALVRKLLLMMCNIERFTLNISGGIHYFYFGRICPLLPLLNLIPQLEIYHFL